MNVGEIMTQAVKFCGPDSDLESVAMDMWNHDCGCIPVVDENGKPVGIITDRDIAMAGALSSSFSMVRWSSTTTSRRISGC